MYQYAAFVFYMVVCWHKLGGVENEYTLHNSIVFALFVPKKLSKSVEIWQSYDKINFDCFFWNTVYTNYICCKNFPLST